MHHGGGVGIGYSLHAGMVIVADGTAEADRRLERVLTCDPGMGVAAMPMPATPKRPHHRARARGAHSHAGDRSMMAPHAGLERRVLSALEASPARVPVVIGGCGTGRSTLLHALADRMGRDVPVRGRRARGQHARAVPAAVVASSPFAWGDPRPAPTSAREAFDRTLALLTACAPPATGPPPSCSTRALELRTFESFPGLRHVLRELLQALADSGNRFVLTSRYVARAHRLLRDGMARFEVIHLPALAPARWPAMLPPMGDTADDRELPRQHHPRAGRRPRRLRACDRPTPRPP
jgi:hypothetical protein